jgi:hypothetical protein
MTIRSQRDFWPVSFWSLWAGVRDRGRSTTSASPRPGRLLPARLGLILTVLGLIVLATSLVREIEGGDPVGSIPWRPLICIAGALVFFGFALPRVGFVISFPLMIVFTAMAGDEFRWKEAIFNAVLLTAFSYGVFVAGLKLTIPLWPA